ncbi:hypothetical protein ACTFIY_000994 [Dictyostelium cf. discoideum]
MSINSKSTINDVLLNQESIQKKNKYSCPICFEFIYKKSIFQSLKNKEECMVCRSEVNSTNDLSTCLVIEQNFGKKECFCIYSFKNYDFIDCSSLEKITLVKDEENGCNEIINVDQLDTHIKNCKFKFIKCSHNGCDEVLRLNSLEEHENKCDFKLVKCEYCSCDDIIKMELKNHHMECPKFPVGCPQGCSIIIERHQIKSHIDNDCNNSTILCNYYTFGCKVEMKRSELQNHLINVNHQIFMGLLIDKLSSTLIQSLDIQDELVKKIEQSEKTQKKLIEEVDQSKIICDKLQKQNGELSSLITDMNNTCLKKKNFTSSLEFLNFLQYKNEWIISDYPNVVNKFPNCHKLESPPFQINSNSKKEWDWSSGWSRFIESNLITKENESIQKKNKYSCPICFEFIYKKSIYQCRSGHMACQECWEKSLKNKKECMICRSEVNSTKDLSRCLVIEQFFGKKECYCIYSFNNDNCINGANQEIKILIKDEENGCNEIINVDELDTHIQYCKFKFVKCSHNGCDEILRLNSLEGHENQCGFKLVKYNSTIPCKYFEYGYELIKKIEQSEKNQEKLISDKLQKQNNELTSFITEMKDTCLKKKNLTDSLEYLNLLEYKNKWIISDYSKIVDKYPKGSILISPSFQIYSYNSLVSQSQLEFNSYKFEIHICPNGIENSPNFLSLFLNGKRVEGTSVEFICKLVNVLDKTKSNKLKTHRGNI